ncbi:MAG: hypothetical protein ACXW30_05255 [Micavibrio sp.]
MIRGKVLFLSLSAIGVLAAILSLIEMWTYFLDWDVFLKIMGTFLILGTQISFLMAIDYDLPASRRKWLLLGLVTLSVVASGLVTLQIWTQAFEWSVFLKLVASLAIIFVLVGFLLAVAEDFGTNKRLKDNNYVD